MQKTKALRVEFFQRISEEWKSRQILIFCGGGCSGNSRGKTWGLISLAIRALPHDLVTGGIPHAGSWQNPAIGDGQGGLVCCGSWSCKESDTTEWLNWTELNYFTILWWFLPYIHMNQPWVYMCSSSWAPLLPPSPSHPSGSSQCTSPEHSVSCLEPGLVICFTYDNIHVSILFSQIIPPSPSPTESKSLFFTFVSLLLSHTCSHQSSLPSF